MLLGVLETAPTGYLPADFSNLTRWETSHTHSPVGFSKKASEAFTRPCKQTGDGLARFRAVTRRRRSATAAWACAPCRGRQ